MAFDTALFRTPYRPAPSRPLLTPEKPLLLLGSCFTDEIGSRMRASMWDVAANPCGTLFNPASIARNIRIALGKLPCDVHEESPGELISWDMQGPSVSADECRRRHEILAEYLRSAQAIIVTFGTAWVYELADEPGRIVANCHKLPAARFLRRRLSVEEICTQWRNLVAEMRNVNPGMQIILTVSPVRHLKDGFEGNSRSKATLLLAAERLCEEIDGCRYFPAYEIVTDDLRDYRFYADDMVHPAPAAVEYIGDIFHRTYLSETHREVLREAAALRASLRHRPINPDAPQAIAFRKQTANRLAEFLKKHSYLKP